MAGVNISLLTLFCVFCLIPPSLSNDDRRSVTNNNQTFFAENGDDQTNAGELVGRTRRKDKEKNSKKRNNNEKILKTKYEMKNKGMGSKKHKISKRSESAAGYKLYEGLGPSCYSIYTPIKPYPDNPWKSLRECKNRCDQEPQCGAFLMGKAKIMAGDKTKCYMVKPNKLFTQCVWSESGYYNAYQKLQGGCTGTSSDWDCCTPTSPCSETQGDCDNDSDCSGSLVCGFNNCKKINPLADAAADCCVKPNKAGTYGIGDSYVNQKSYCFWAVKCSNVHNYKRCCKLFSPFCDTKTREKCNKNTRKSCGNGWASVGTGCYKVINAVTFEQGIKFCEEEGSSLVEITSQAEQDALSQFYLDSHLSGDVWLGAQKTKENKWKWMDSEREITFNLWGKGDLNNALGTENCLVWDGGKSWKDINCEHRNINLKTFCEKRQECEPDSITQNTASSVYSKPCACGTRNKKSRIVGGQTAEKNEFPWQVALKYGNAERPFCGGTLIGEKTVLTAAHCTEGLMCAEDITVLTGEHNVMDDSDGQREIEVKQIIENEKYNYKNKDYDFSLLILKNPIQCDDKVKPIRLPKQSKRYENVKAIVSGWGEKDDNLHSDMLRKADVTTMTNTNCTTGTLYNTSDITPRMICASGSKGDACFGDSGGPLVAQESDNYFSLIGVVSWGGLDCGEANSPGVYARVAQESLWIQDNMVGHTCIEDSVYMMAGGYGDGDISLYHPSNANMRCSTPPPALNKYWVHHSSFYHDNTIYLCGGIITASICISHTPGNPWKTHTLTTSRKYHSTVVLQKRVYFIGGQDSSNNYLGAVSTVLPLTDTPVFTPVHNLNYKGERQCTAKIDQHNLVITGGYNHRVNLLGALSTVSTYNIRTEDYTQLPSLKQARDRHGCGVWEEGNNKWIIVAGGYDNGELQTTEMLELGKSQWTSLGDLKVGRLGHSMAVTQRGVMVMGGRDASGHSYLSVELLDWSTKTWSLVEPSINKDRSGFGGAVEIPASMFGCKTVLG